MLEFNEKWGRVTSLFQRVMQKQFGVYRFVQVPGVTEKCQKSKILKNITAKNMEFKHIYYFASSPSIYTTFFKYTKSVIILCISKEQSPLTSTQKSGMPRDQKQRWQSKLCSTQLSWSRGRS